MPVILHTPVEGKQVGETYTGSNEQYLVENGKAKWANGDPYDGVYTGVAYDHSDDGDLYDAEYESTSTVDGYVAPIDPSTVTNGDAPVRDYEPTEYGPANPSTDGHLPAVSDPGADPFADER